MLKDKDIEKCFNKLGLRYTKVEKDTWELKFRTRSSIFTLYVLNGRTNPKFVRFLLLYMWPITAHTDVFHKKLLELNSSFGLCKFEVDSEGNVLIGANLLREFFSCEKLRVILDSILQTAEKNYLELLTLAKHGR